MSSTDLLRLPCLHCLETNDAEGNKDSQHSGQGKYPPFQFNLVSEFPWLGRESCFPTFVPSEAELVIWLREFEATIAGIPKGSLSQRACKLLAHWAIILALTFALKLK